LTKRNQKAQQNQETQGIGRPRIRPIAVRPVKELRRHSIMGVDPVVALERAVPRSVSAMFTPQKY